MFINPGKHHITTIKNVCNVVRMLHLIIFVAIQIGIKMIL